MYLLPSVDQVPCINALSQQSHYVKVASGGGSGGGGGGGGDGGCAPPAERVREAVREVRIQEVDEPPEPEGGGEVFAAL